MELKEKKFKDTVLGAQKELSFSIDSESSVIFDILRDKMYSNKIGAICREVPSNSRDANREAGNGDIPIEIEIIQPEDTHNIGQLVGHQVISFRDFGVGITPQRMEDIYLKYAASTKRDTNSQTGGFGLGAKTPFAYTDTFTVITVCEWEDKIQRFTYTAMIDSSRKGKMVLFDVEECSDDTATGTEVIVPINDVHDRLKFERECLEYTSYWGEDAVKYIGFSTNNEPKKIIFDTDDYTLFFDENSDSRYKMLIDGIPYPLNGDNVVGIRGNDGLGRKFCIGLKFDVGVLTISANRESVQYDEETTEAIQQKIDSMKESLSEKIRGAMSNFDSYLEGCIKLTSLMTNRLPLEEDLSNLDDVLMNRAFRTGDWSSDKGLLWKDRESFKESLKFDGKSLKTKFRFHHHKFFVVKDAPYGQKMKYDAKTDFVFTKKLVDMPKYYADKKRNGRRNRTIWEDYGHEQFVLISPVGKNEEAQREEMEEFLFNHSLDMEMYGDVPMKKADNTFSSGDYKYTPGETITVKCREFVNRSSVSYNESSSLEIDRKSKELTEGDWTDFIVMKVDSIRNVDKVMESPFTLEKMRVVQHYTEKPILFINEKSYKSRFEGKGCLLLEDEFDRLKKKHVKEWRAQKLSKTILNMARNSYQSGGCSHLIEQFPDLAPQCVKDAIANENSDNKKSFHMTYLMDESEIKFNREGLESKLKKIAKKYLLATEFLRNNYGTPSTEEMQHLESYISSVA